MNREEFINNQKKNYNSYTLPKITLLHHIYDLLVYLFHNFPHKEANKEVRNLCKEFKLKHKLILDLGSYTGYKSFYFHAERNKVIGIDQSDKMINYAIKRYKNYNITFLHGEILEVLKTNIADNTIDFIHCNVMPLHYDTGNIETSPYIEEVILSLLKKLKPNGILYYSFYTIKSQKVWAPITKESLVDFLHKINITNYKIRINEVNRFNNPTVECIITKNEIKQ